MAEFEILYLIHMALDSRVCNRYESYLQLSMGHKHPDIYSWVQSDCELQFTTLKTSVYKLVLGLLLSLLIVGILCLVPLINKETVRIGKDTGSAVWYRQPSSSWRYVQNSTENMSIVI